MNEQSQAFETLWFPVSSILVEIHPFHLSAPNFGTVPYTGTFPLVNKRVG